MLNATNVVTDFCSPLAAYVLLSVTLQGQAFGHQACCTVFVACN